MARTSHFVFTSKIFLLAVADRPAVTIYRGSYLQIFLAVIQGFVKVRIRLRKPGERSKTLKVGLRFAEPMLTRVRSVDARQRLAPR